MKANKPPRPLKVAVMLPQSYRGGTLNGAKNLAKMLVLGSRGEGINLSVVFSCFSNFYDTEKELADLRELNIEIRETKWETISKQKIKSMFLEEINGPEPPLYFDKYIVPNDGICSFTDCDFWFIISDRTTYPLAPLKPYGMVIYDYIQRYIPEIFRDYVWNEFEKGYIQSARQAKFVITTTPQTKGDAISYAGVNAKKVLLAPMEFDPLSENTELKTTNFKFENITGPYFIWTTNSTQHKNHLNAIRALEKYYLQLKGNMKVVMTGDYTRLFDQKNKEPLTALPYVAKVRAAFEKADIVKQNLIIAGNVDVNEYIKLLSSATFLWHPCLIDNGTYSVVEAAYRGVPSLSSSYPAMHYIDKRFNIGLTFFNATDIDEMAYKLKLMERECSKLSKNLPDQLELESFSYKNTAKEFWNLIKSYL